MRRAFALATILVGVSLAGCSGGSGTPTSAAPQALVVTPADGAATVRLDAPVTLSFARAADRPVVERDLHLISEHAMTDSPCPGDVSMMSTTMADWMADTTLMRHMDEFHSVPGHFTWNDAGTTCTFRPDSMMTPLTQYMIHMGPEMMSMTEQMGDGAMGGHGSGMMSGDMMVHFTTMDTTGGHAGHH